MLGRYKNMEPVNYGDWIVDADGKLFEVVRSSGDFLILTELKLTLMGNEVAVHKSRMYEFDRVM